MTSLREEIKQRRTDAFASECVSGQPSRAGLIVCQWRSESWVLPWSQFVGARFRGKDSDGQLEIRFANYHVTVAGENLRGLLEPLAAQEIGCLRDLPAGYRSRTGDSAPFVTKIDVQALPADEASPPQL